MGEWLLSRRDGAIVAWHEVPGTAPPKSRPVGYGLIRAGVRTDSIGSDEISNTKYIASLKKHGTHLRRKIPLGLAAPDHTVPDGTVLSRTLSKALRARLRSCCPSGTKYILRANLQGKLTGLTREAFGAADLGAENKDLPTKVNTTISVWYQFWSAARQN